MIFLDTNAVIAVMNDAPRRVADVLAERLAAREQIVISSIVLFELWFGIAKSTRKSGNAEKLGDILSAPIQQLAFDSEDALVAGKVRQELALKGTPIGPYDVLIAGQALRHGATLVTANSKEFKRVRRLKCEDWAKG